MCDVNTSSRLNRVATVATTILLTGCASTERGPVDASIDVDNSAFIPQSMNSISFSPVPNGIGEENLKEWNSFTDTPYIELEEMLWYGRCGLVDWLPKSPAGSWQLTAVRATTVYVPVFDIEALRAGKTSKNKTVYYYFKLVER